MTLLWHLKFGQANAPIFTLPSMTLLWHLICFRKIRLSLPYPPRMTVTPKLCKQIRSFWPYPLWRYCDTYFFRKALSIFTLPSMTLLWHLFFVSKIVYLYLTLYDVTVTPSFFIKMLSIFTLPSMTLLWHLKFGQANSPIFTLPSVTLLWHPIFAGKFVYLYLTLHAWLWRLNCASKFVQSDLTLYDVTVTPIFSGKHCLSLPYPLWRYCDTYFFKRKCVDFYLTLYDVHTLR
jgi:hypothetical protein